nr:patatin-like phospholipase family protein [Dechloromonas sp.]
MSDNASPPASPPEPPVFRLGLTLAGAVSAGAYSAGVLDFLREALDAWERAKANGKDSSGNSVPQHKVQIKAISGTSAGAMCAAMFVGTLRTQPAANPSPLYTAWVDQIDIDPMLDDADLLAANGVKSLLNCRILDDIAQQILPSNNSAFSLPPWVAENTELFLCTTSLRGIPYNINAYPGGENPYGMALHAGVMKYRLISTGTTPSLPIDAIPLAANAPPANWDNLRDAALASGAFPLALQARITNTPLEPLLNRRWEVPDDKVGRRLQYQHEITPAISGPSTNFTALCVDGGAINNEPVEHVRLALSLPPIPSPGCPIKRLERDLKEAEAATILIDPFPDAQDFKEKYEARLDLWSVIKGLVPAVMNQLRFKADELILAESMGVGSRYLISPKRQIPEDRKGQPNLACGALGGFLGFIDRAFRHHDYQLGRLNCQRFLARHFYMDMQSEGLGDNRQLFANTPEAYKGAAYFDGDLPAIVAEQLAAKPPNPNILPVPVIPLMPELRDITAAIGSQKLDWPKYDRKHLDGLERRIRNRLDGVLTRIMDFLNIPVRRWLLSGFATLLRVNPAVRGAESIRKAIETALDKAGL